MVINTPIKKRDEGYSSAVTVSTFTRLSMKSSSRGISSLSSRNPSICNSIATFIWAIVSSMVSPCEKQPGSEGTSAQYPLLGSLCINIVYSVICFHIKRSNSSSVKPAFFIAAFKRPIFNSPDTGIVKKLPVGHLDIHMIPLPLPDLSTSVHECPNSISTPDSAERWHVYQCMY